MPLRTEGNVPVLDTTATAMEAEAIAIKQDKQTTVRDLEAMAKSAGKSNFIAKGVDWLVSPSFKDEEDFKLSGTESIGIMEKNNISWEYSTDFANIKSEEELNYVVEEAVKKTSDDKFINETITASTQGVSSVVGSLVDIDLIAGVGVSKVFKLKSIYDVIKVTGSVEAVSAVAKTQLGPNYHMEDAVFDIALGTLIDTGVVRYFNGADAARIGNDVKASDSVMSDAVHYTDEEFEAIRTEARASRLDIVNKKKIAEEEKIRLKKVQEDISSQITSTHAKDYENTIGDIKKYDELEEARYKQEQKEIRDYFEKKFSEPKYETWRTNLKEFLNTQKNINSVVLSKSLNEIHLNIKGFKSQIAKLEERLSRTSNPSWKTRYKKQLDEAKEGLESEKSKLSQDVEYNQKQVAKREADEIYAMVNRMSDDIIGAVDELTEIIKTMDDVQKADIKDTVQEMIRQYPEETKALASIFGKKNKSVLDMSSMSMKNKILLTGLGLAVPSAVMADDGEPTVMGSAIYVIAALFAGIQGVRMVKGAGGVSASFGNIGSSIDKFANRIHNSYKSKKLADSAEGQSLKGVENHIVDEARTALTETFEPIARVSKEARELMSKLLFNPENGKYSAEVSKLTEMRKTMDRYFSVENSAYTLWLKENGFNKFTSIFQEVDLKIKFREAVSDAVEGVLDAEAKGSKHIQNTADAFKKESELIFSTAQGVEVYGFKNIKPKSNYFPRLWKTDYLKEIIRTADDITPLLDGLSTAIQATGKTTAKADALAENFIKNIKEGSGKNVNATQQENIFGQLESMLKDDVEMEEFSNAFNTKGDIVGRGKGRINMDLNALPEITLIIDGKPKVISKGDLVERNSVNALERLANTMHGSIALAEQGFKSRSALNIAINEVRAVDSSAGSQLDDIADMIAGIPLKVSNVAMTKVVNAIRDITMVDKLRYVAFSMFPELYKTALNGGIHVGMKNMVKAILDKGEDSFASHMMSITGQATSMNRHVGNLRGFSAEEITLGEQSFETLNKVKNVAFMANLLVPVSDWLQKANLITNAERVEKFLRTGKGLQPTRLQGWGIDDKFIAEFKNDFILNDKGSLKNFDTSSWSKEKTDSFNNVMFRLGQDSTMEVTMGQSGHWSYATDLGKAASSLVKYPMNLYGNQGIKNAKHMDTVTLTQITGDFMGAYVGLQLKYSYQGKEVDDEQVMLYAMMNIAQLSSLSLITSLGSPAIVDTTKTLTAPLNPN